MVARKNNKRIVVIAGPSGCGESTITDEIVKRYPIFRRMVSATSRKPRLKEKNKKDYYFFTEKKFKELINKRQILEHQNNRNGVYYGTYKPELEKKLKQGFQIIINPDLVGAKFYKKNFNATTIFIQPDTILNLKKRHLARDPRISPEKLKQRLQYAKHEIKDEMPFYDYIVTNRQNQLPKAVKEVEKILNKEGYIT